LQVKKAPLVIKKQFYGKNGSAKLLFWREYFTRQVEQYVKRAASDTGRKKLALVCHKAMPVMKPG